MVTGRQRMVSPPQARVAGTANIKPVRQSYAAASLKSCLASEPQPQLNMIGFQDPFQIGNCLGLVPQLVLRSICLDDIRFLFH